MTTSPICSIRDGCSPANGLTAMWDGAYAGLQEIVTSGFGYRALILLTDGADNASTKTTEEVMPFAV
ncbi:MAG: hypothetical protein IPP94_14680 [Ignavibacteria bacterium]|nr:hypothetical protein [Ignavibacteria bacterium]